MGKKPIDQSLQNEFTWYLSTLKYLQEGIEMVKNLDPSIAKFVDELTDKEAQAYARCMLALAGVDDQILSIHGGPMSHGHLAEPFQNAWRKLRGTEDEIRKAWDAQNIGQVYCKGIKHTGSHKGFDDVLLAWDQDEGRWILRIIEQKTNTYQSIYLTKKGTDAIVEIVDNAERIADDFYQKLLKAGMDENEAKRIFNSILGRSTTSANAIGIDFLRKVNSGNLLDTLKSAEPALGDATINQILEAAIKQNQLIALIEQGSAYEMVMKNGYWTTAIRDSSDVIDSINLNYLPTGGGNPIDIIFDAKVFSPDFEVVNGKKFLKKPEFPGPNIKWDSLSDAQKTAYNELNNLIDNAVGEFDLCIEDLPANQIAGKINEIQSLIYDKLMCTGVFDEFQILSGGSINFCLETLSTPNGNSVIKNLLESFFDQNGIVTYHYHQMWDAPFCHKMRQLFGGTGDESLLSRDFKERWFKMLLADSNYDVNSMTLGEIEQLVKKDSLIGEALLRNFQDPFRLPDGNFWKVGDKGTIDKALVFYDKNTGKPLKHLIGGTEYNVYMNYDLQKMLKELGLDAELLQNPISFSLKDGRFIVDFNPTSGASRAGTRGAGRADTVADAWINHLAKRYGVPNDVLERLKGRLGHGCGVDLFNPQADEELLKLFALILSDFKRNCDEAFDFLRRKITQVGSLDIDWGTTKLRNHADELGGIHIDWNGGIRIGDTEVELHLGQLKKTDRPNPTWESGRGVYSLGVGASWIGKYINEIKIQALNTIFQFPKDPKAVDFFKWVTANWGSIS